MTNPITNSVLLNSLTFQELSDNQNLISNEPLPRDYETMSHEELKRRLTVFISDLLESNFEKLCNMVYRHDVSETRFNEALQSGSMMEQAENISDLVIERELEKVKSRQLYRQQKEEKMKKNIREAN
jgi:uncharacterized membrane protein YheB (UPF0754 family)